MSTPRFDRRELNGRLALVTGAGSGIGRATVFALAEAGVRVLAVDVNEASVQRTAELASLLGGPVHALVADVSDEAAMAALDECVMRDHGVVDLLINNAGIAVAGSFMETSIEAWQATLGVNVWGVVHGCRLFGQRMVARGQGGHIVNVASIAAFQPSRSLPAYCTSKAAVLMLSECLRAELAPLKIGVTAVCPGIVNTNITRNARFAGRTDAEQAALREDFAGWYKLRDFPPEKVANELLQAVRYNVDVIAVTPEAQVIHGLARFAPFALKLLAGFEAIAPRKTP